ncbi:Metaxin 1 [Aphelenchoides avenae]|nr:Metaxin 1 [Aphelenchus avenae]
MQLLWNDSHNYGAVTQYSFSSKLSFPYNLYYLEKRRTLVQAYVKSMGRTDPQLTMDAVQALNWLSAKLGDNKYFCGDKPSSLDALVFGYLAPLLKTPLPNDRLQLHLSSIPNLVRFVESIISIYLPLSDESVREQAAEKKAWSKRKANAQKLLEDGKLRHEAKRTERENSKNVPLRDTILFAVGAVTLSVLFAVHTGIIQFVHEGEEPE